MTQLLATISASPETDRPDGEPERPKVLVIAGYDQSGGAGILADIKTLEAHSVYGYAVCTGLTFQNERIITRVQWCTEKEIFEQIDLCCQSVRFDWVKIGICRSVAMIGSILRHLRETNPAIKIVLDPVIRASSGRGFWEGIGREGFESVASQIYLLTPNWEEIGWLYPEREVMDSCRSLSASCNLYLKGGHNPEHPGRDYLWSNGTVKMLEPVEGPERIFPKHGSGCVLASSLAANLSLGYPLSLAAAKSKIYVEKFLMSNKTLLGWHQSLENQVL